MSEIVKRLNDTLAGVEVPQMKGDNLAVTLCSAFDDHGPEVDDYGWSQSALDGYNATMDAIKAHYAPAAAEIQRLTTALENARKAMESAAKIFRWYEEIHSGKSPPDTDKAFRNRQAAEALETAILALTPPTEKAT